MANEYGNYCVISPLNKHASITLANGNLSVTGTSGGQEAAGTIAVKTGKWAIEFTAGGAGGSFGFGDQGIFFF